MLRKLILCASLACFSAGTIVTAGAEAAPAPAVKPGKGQGDKEKLKAKLKEKIDTNHDGKISKEELAAFKAAHPDAKGKLAGKAKK